MSGDDLLRLRLERATFGSTAKLEAEVATLGFDAWLDLQLDPNTRTADRSYIELTDAIEASFPDLTTLRDVGKSDRGALRRAAIVATTSRTVLGAAYAPDQLRQRMVDLLADRLHVAISQSVVVYYVPGYDQMLRDGAFGRFADLLANSARHPAMLYYLDNATSRADGSNVPNENFARELLELHTVGVDGGFDEGDVAEVAHVLSGWSIDRSKSTFAFRPDRHSIGGLSTNGDVLGWRPRTAGEAAGIDLIEHLAHHPATESRLALLLARRFVSEDISPEDPLVSEAGEVYRDNDTALGPVVRHLLTSDRFAEAATPMLRRPVDLVATTLRRGAPPPSSDRVPATGAALSGLLRHLGQVPYFWPAPNGYPTSSAAWANAGAVITRWNAMATLVDGAVPGIELDPARLGAENRHDLLVALCGPDIQLM